MNKYFTVEVKVSDAPYWIPEPELIYGTFDSALVGARKNPGEKLPWRIVAHNDPMMGTVVAWASCQEYAKK